MKREKKKKKVGIEDRTEDDFRVRSKDQDDDPKREVDKVKDVKGEYSNDQESFRRHSKWSKEIELLIVCLQKE